MAKYTWIKKEVEEGLLIRQVYGVAFSKNGKVLLRTENNKYYLTGGKPEGKETYEETLKREYLEEVNIEVGTPYYLGYLLVDEEDGTKPYAQVRMITHIEKVNEVRPDIDSGKTYGRFLANPENVKAYLNYGTAGNLLIDDAIAMAKEKYQFDASNEEEHYI